MERDCQHGLYKAGMGSSRVLSDFAEKYGSKNRVMLGFGIGGKSGKEKIGGLVRGRGGWLEGGCGEAFRGLFGVSVWREGVMLWMNGWWWVVCGVEVNRMVGGGGIDLYRDRVDLIEETASMFGK
ncbi:hypothetical protein Tco_1005830 [Tanacetum coccineum]|uniref:Uncharacterized protein n=1 Tax=Tanacetum coccineum TaxID=301880 RepID=A0ABQ5FGA2_9ASTR